MVSVPWLLGDLFEHDTGAQTLQGLDSMALPAVLLLRVQVRVALRVIISPLREQMRHPHQHLLRDGHRRFLLAQAPVEAPECPPQKRRRCAGRPGTLDHEAPHVPMALPVRPLRRLPALSLWPGETRAHAAKRPAAPQRRISTPISAIISRAAMRSTPGMLSNWASWGWSGVPNAPMCWSRSALCCANRAIRSKAPWIRRPGWTVHGPAKASASCGSLWRTLPNAKAESRWGSRSPAIKAARICRPLLPTAR